MDIINQFRGDSTNYSFIGPRSMVKKTSNESTSEILEEGLSRGTVYDKATINELGYIYEGPCETKGYEVWCDNNKEKKYILENINGECYKCYKIIK